MKILQVRSRIGFVAAELSDPLKVLVLIVDSYHL